VQPKSKKIATIVLRTVVCVGVMYLVLRNVHWNDVAVLANDGSQVRIVNWQEVKNDSRLEDLQQIGEVAVKVQKSIDQEPFEITLSQLALNKEGAPDFEIGLVTAWKSSNKSMILLAVLIFAPVALLQAIRFTWMVRAQEIDLSYWEGIKLSYAGNIMNFVAIGTTGGDIYKAYYVSTHTNRKTEVVTTVFLDRAVGLISLLLIAAGAMLLKFDDPKIRFYAPFIGMLMAGLAVGAIVVFSQRIRRFFHIDQILEKLPFSSHLLRIDATTRRMRHHKKLIIMAILTTIILQGLAITSITITAFGLGMNNDPSLYAGYYAYIAMGLLIATIPVSYQGGGTMDGALQIFLQGTYGNFSQILFVGFAIRILQLFWALPGILVPITGAHRPSTEKIAQFQSQDSTNDHSKS